MPLAKLLWRAVDDRTSPCYLIATDKLDTYYIYTNIDQSGHHTCGIRIHRGNGFVEEDYYGIKGLQKAKNFAERRRRANADLSMFGLKQGAM